MNTKNLIVRALLAPLAVVLSLGAVACDQPDSDTASFVFEVEELAEMALDAGDDELAELLLEDAAPIEESSLSLAVEEEAPSASTNTLEQCFVDFCFFADPSYAYSGQCSSAQPHPLGMEGVCILVGNLPAGCEAYAYSGEYCSTITAS